MERENVAREGKERVRDEKGPQREGVKTQGVLGFANECG